MAVAFQGGKLVNARMECLEMGSISKKVSHGVKRNQKFGVVMTRDRKSHQVGWKGSGRGFRIEETRRQKWDPECE
jgi:hypothetical protein